MRRGLSLSRSLLALTVIVALFTLSGCAGAPAATTVPAEPTAAVATSAPTEAATEEATEAATEVATEAATAEVTEEVTAETPEAAGGAAGGTLDAALVQAGEANAESIGCRNCHSTDGSEGGGPTWLGVFGSTVPLADGSTVEADVDYIRESILDPQAKIVEGFGPIMPDLSDQLTDEQVESLVTFIMSLGTGT